MVDWWGDNADEIFGRHYISISLPNSGKSVSGKMVNAYLRAIDASVSTRESFVSLARFDHSARGVHRPGN